MIKPISILLVDDHPVVRAGYRRLLETTPEMQVVAEAADGEEPKGYPPAVLPRAAAPPARAGGSSEGRLRSPD